MLKAIDINTKEVIATGSVRSELAAIAANIVGRDGFAIRDESACTATPKNWAKSDGHWWN